MKITIVATGFESAEEQKEEEKKNEGKKRQITLMTPESGEDEGEIPVSTPRVKVVGGYENEDILDIPTWMRNQMD